MSISNQELENICHQVRRDILRMVHNAKGGHPGGAMGCADYIASLYFKYMTHNKNFSMDGAGEDLFFLSNGHITAVWYSVLAHSGYFETSELSTHRKLNSRLQGHPTPHEHLPGIRMASGSLGQGLSVAIGAAQAKKLNKDDKKVYVLMGDGELQEGQIWEAAMYASHHKIDNIIAAVDYNGQQIDGPLSEVMDLLDLAAKWRSFGWEVITCNKGNDLTDIHKSIEAAQSASGKQKPVMILLKTEMAFGVDFMVGHHKWHGNAPSDEQLAKALSQIPETLGDFKI
jgi:transketolase